MDYVAAETEKILNVEEILQGPPLRNVKVIYNDGRQARARAVFCEKEINEPVRILVSREVNLRQTRTTTYIPKEYGEKFLVAVAI